MSSASGYKALAFQKLPHLLLSGPKTARDFNAEVVQYVADDVPPVVAGRHKHGGDCGEPDFLQEAPGLTVWTEALRTLQGHSYSLMVLWLLNLCGLLESRERARGKQLASQPLATTGLPWQGTGTIWRLPRA